MLKKSTAQTATEYLIILAVVIVIALIVVGTLGGIPSIGTGASKNSADIQLKNLPIAVSQYSFNETSGKILLSNKNSFPVKINSLVIDAFDCNIPQSIINSGSSKLFYCDINSLERYSYDFEINWTDLNSNSKYYIKSSAKLTGDVANFNSAWSSENSSEDPPDETPEDPPEDPVLNCFGDSNLDSVYEICTCDDLQAIGNSATNRSRSYILMNNVDFNNCDSSYTSGVGFSPIGYDSTHSFLGSFNGNNKEITNLYINSTSSNVGFFGYLKSGNVRNVILKNVNVKGMDNVGGLVGYFTGSSGNILFLVNSSVTGSVQGNNYVAGIIGYSAYSNLYNLDSDSVVIGGTYVGEISGYLTQSFLNVSTSSGTITGTSNVGGLVGGIRSSKVINSSSSVEITGTSYFGGIWGRDLMSSSCEGIVTWENYIGDSATVCVGSGTCTGCIEI